MRWLRKIDAPRMRLTISQLRKVGHTFASSAEIADIFEQLEIF
jgi:hypothetical protein